MSDATMPDTTVDATVSDAGIATPFRPLTALQAAFRLMHNPEDTSQVFVILAALRGRSAARRLQRFRACAAGAAVLAERRRLLDRLTDRVALAALPDGSLGRAYLAFMEGEELSADGLVEASGAGRRGVVGADVALFLDRMRDMHDLTHVVTGYGRDPLGELCLLGFMYRHTGNPGGALIALMGMSRFPGGRLGRLGRAALFEGFRQGRQSDWLPGQDWEALLGRPLAAVRRQLGIPVPARYQAAVAALEGETVPMT